MPSTAIFLPLLIEGTDQAHLDRHIPMRFPKQVRVTNFPFRYLVVAPERTVGLIRILKNASTELTTAFGCTEWMPVEEFTGTPVCFLRDPVDRLLSAIPETLLRIREPLPFRRHTHSVVYANADIYLSLQRAARQSMDSLVDTYCDVLRHGFFDAHHAPQWHFLADWSGEPFCDPHVYRVEELASGVEDVTKRFGVPARTTSRYNSGDDRWRGQSALRQRLKQFLGRSSHLDPVDPDHPLLLLLAASGLKTAETPAAPTRRTLMDAASALYPLLKSLKSNVRVEIIIDELYSIDRALHQAAATAPIGTRLAALTHLG